MPALPPDDFASILPPVPPQAPKPPTSQPTTSSRPARRVVFHEEFPALPNLDQQSFPALLELLRRPSWDHQRAVVEALVRRAPSSIPALRTALRSKHPRIALLAAHALARLQKQEGLDTLLAYARRYHDQAGMLILGGFLAYGERAKAPLCQALSTHPHPRLLLQALGLLQATECTEGILRFLASSEEETQQRAIEAITRFPLQHQRFAFSQALARSNLPLTVRANLLRQLAQAPSQETLSILLAHRRHANASIRFLARLLLADSAALMHKRLPKLFPPLPKRPALPLWLRWHALAKDAIAQYDALPAPPKLTSLPKAYNPRKTWLLYTQIHPLFGVGWMPIFLHDEAWKDAKAPIPGKVWMIPLPSSAFSQLLQTLQQRGLFQIAPHTGYRRKIILHANGKELTLQAGDIRDLAFEAIEEPLRKLAEEKAKLGLLFEDLYRRPDEEAISGEGMIGQWVYRKADKLPAPSWFDAKAWRGRADLESTFAALQSLFRYLPSRTRLASLDMRDDKIRLATLLFGSKHLSTQTFAAIERAQRLRDINPQGIRMIYLAREKIEMAIFSVRRLLIPLGTQSHRAIEARATVLDTLRDILQHKSLRVDDLQWSVAAHQPLHCQRVAEKLPPHASPYKNPCKKMHLHRLSLRVRLQDERALLRLLAHLASRSRADRVLALRLNSSGFPDRHRFRILLQLHWEMLSPLPPPSRFPPFLQTPEHPRFSTFQLIYP
jgi:hypothetical protein